MKVLVQTLRLRTFILYGFFLTMLCAYSANSQTLFARTIYVKVEPTNIEAYLKSVNEISKPALQLAKQNGTISDWQLYRVAFASGSSEYNFVIVVVYDSWAKTEDKLMTLEEWIKKSNPKIDAAAAVAKINTLRKFVRQDIYSQVTSLDGPAGSVSKYIMVDYMKPTRGKEDEYVKVETDLWKPIHKELINAGSQIGWSLWVLNYPNGDDLPYSYVTVSALTDYSKVTSFKYEEAFKKAHPGKETQPVMDQTAKSRERVRSELWELVEETK